MSELDHFLPVEKLLSLGETDWDEPRDYAALDIDERHIPDLLRLLTDYELWERNFQESRAAWGPTHALYALADLRAVALIAPSLALMERYVEDDALYEEAGQAWVKVGPPAIPVLTAYLQDPSRPIIMQTFVASGLGEIAEAAPESRDEVVAILSQLLADGATHDPEVNGFVVAALLEMSAREAAPVIEAAFAAGWVDESIVGNWGDVQYELGLVKKPPKGSYAYNELKKRKKK